MKNIIHTSLKIESKKTRNKVISPMRIKQKIGRNHICNCKSGKKYKNCCMNKKVSIFKQLFNYLFS